MKLLLISIIIISLFSCRLKSEKMHNIAAIGYNKDTVNLGVLKKGDTGHAGFEFISNGPVPLRIIEVSASCGCTTLKYDAAKEYEDGEKGFINVDYTPKDGDSGLILKNIVVKTNTEKKLKVLYIKAEVHP